jgi:5-hydroxyisourate hydrolase
MGKLTTHILDTAHGKPASGVHISILAERGGAWVALGTAITNSDGRCDVPLLQDAALSIGRYRLVFHIGPYFRAHVHALGQAAEQPAFLDDVPIEFGVSDATAHYHVPLLVTPWSYSTYRGS